MKRYPAYKDSGIEWIGEIPEHWEVKPIKYVGDIVLGKMLTPDDKGGYFRKPYLRAQNITWEKIDTEDIKEMWLSEKDLSQYRLKENDLLVSEGGEVGRTAIWKNELNECYIQNSVHKITIKSKNNPHYYLYHFQIYGKTGYFDSIVNRVSIAHLTREKLKEIMFLSPTLPEQESIANYLDRKTHLIDTLIEKKQKLIDLLKEQRAAIINHAVTKGLNPDVKPKDSGIEWLGEIPEHWEVKKLKYFAMINPTKDNSLLSKDSGTLVTFLPMEMVNEDGTFITDMKKPIKELWNGFTYFEENDTIVAKITPCFENGKGAFLENLDSMIGFGSTEFHVLREIPDVSISKYLYYITRTNLFRKMGEAFMTGAAGQKRVPTNFIDDFIIGLPSVGEQREITDYLDEQTTRIDKLMEKQERQIEHLKEYRTALISEVVTGKIDVIDSEIQEVIHS